MELESSWRRAEGRKSLLGSVVSAYDTSVLQGGKAAKETTPSWSWGALGHNNQSALTVCLRGREEYYHSNQETRSCTSCTLLRRETLRTVETAETHTRTFWLCVSSLGIPGLSQSCTVNPVGRESWCTVGEHNLYKTNTVVPVIPVSHIRRSRNETRLPCGVGVPLETYSSKEPTL